MESSRNNPLPPQQLPFSTRSNKNNVKTKTYRRAFLSHSGDDKAAALCVARLLLRHGLDFWMDTFHCVSRTEESIYPAIAHECDCFVAVVSSSYEQSLWCMKELGFAEGIQKDIFCLRIAVPPGDDGSGMYHKKLPGTSTRSARVIESGTSRGKVALSIPEEIDELFHKFLGVNLTEREMLKLVPQWMERLGGGNAAYVRSLMYRDLETFVYKNNDDVIEDKNNNKDAAMDRNGGMEIVFEVSSSTSLDKDTSNSINSKESSSISWLQKFAGHRFCIVGLFMIIVLVVGTIVIVVLLQGSTTTATAAAMTAVPPSNQTEDLPELSSTSSKSAPSLMPSTISSGYPTVRTTDFPSSTPSSQPTYVPSARPSKTPLYDVTIEGQVLVNGYQYETFVHNAILAEGQSYQLSNVGLIQDSTDILDSVSDDKRLAWLDGVYSLVYNDMLCVFTTDNVEVIIGPGYFNQIDWVRSPDICFVPFPPTQVVMEIRGYVNSKN